MTAFSQKGTMTASCLQRGANFLLRRDNIFVNTNNCCTFAIVKTYVDMENVTFVNSKRTKSLQKIEVHHGTQQVQATPKERLHTVEEFIDKLEQAVLEKL